MHERGAWVRPARLAPLVVLALAAGCAEDATEVPGPDVVLRVLVDGEVAADWTLVALEEAVPFIETTVDGDTQRGPRLLDVLAASEIVTWDTAEIIGMGESRSFEVSLDVFASEVDDGWVLDVTNRGTLKLAAESLPRQQWVRDVGEIRVP